MNEIIWDEKPKVPKGDIVWDDATEAESLGPVQAAVVGAGRTANDIWAGVKQAGLGMPDAMRAAFNLPVGADNSKALAQLDAEQKSNAPANTALDKAHPVAATLGGIAPLLAMPMLGGGVLGMSAAGAIPGMVEYGTAEEKAKRGAMGALGGAVGAGVGKVIARVPQPFKPNLTQFQQESRAAADRLGIKLRAGEAVDSKPLRWFQSMLDDLPFSGGMARTADQARKAKINGAAAKSIGINGATEVTEDVLSTARQQIGGEFQRILGPLEVPLDKQFVSEVRAITNSKVMKALRNDSTEAIIAPFRDIPKGVKAKGDWFQQNLSALNDEIRAAYTAGEVGKARALENFEKALHGAALRGMSAEDRAAYELARKQWANLRILETGKVIDGGNVVPHRLESALQSRYKHTYKEGGLSGELVDIAKAGHSMRTMPQSGTTPRAIYSGAAGGMAFASPITTAAMMAGPPLAQKILQSDAARKYLTQGLLNVSPEAERLLMMGGSGLLGGAGTIGAR